MIRLSVHKNNEHVTAESEKASEDQGENIDNTEEQSSSSFVDDVIDDLNNDKSNEGNNDAPDVILKDPVYGFKPSIITYGNISNEGSDRGKSNKQSNKEIDNNEYLSNTIAYLNDTILANMRQIEKSQDKEYLNRLKSGLSNLDIKNDTMKQRFTDNTELMQSWNECYIFLNDIRPLLNSKNKENIAVSDAQLKSIEEKVSLFVDNANKLISVYDTIANSNISK